MLQSLAVSRELICYKTNPQKNGSKSNNINALYRRTFPTDETGQAIPLKALEMVKVSTWFKVRC
jgi:hypothetical protein